jgi:hypothetical protein
MFWDEVVEWDKIGIVSTEIVTTGKGVAKWIEIKGYANTDELSLKPIVIRISLDKFKLSEEKLRNTIEKVMTSA